VDTPALISTVAADFMKNVDKMALLQRFKRQSPENKVEDRLVHYSAFWVDLIMAVGKSFHPFLYYNRDRKLSTGYTKFAILREYMRPEGQLIYDGICTALKICRYQMDTGADESIQIVMSLYTNTFLFAMNLLPPGDVDEGGTNTVLEPSLMLLGILSFLRDGNASNTSCAGPDCPRPLSTIATSLCSGCHFVGTAPPSASGRRGCGNQRRTRPFAGTLQRW